ncbi:MULTISPECIES: ead/Ea22-like family protein [Pseudomonas]|uniref:ead/Ea22-like family protein n=1 Tax=Pseudomonas TaxID=286 RepID=UPI0002A16506|nr:MULTISPECIES: ead/Ea22-like family protein [Pseudomonas]AGA72958.1 hypothetical protein B479_10280 [Pseudomonas putida HB3267]MCE0946229.1 hypothetical protein [Pseudomonas asiatica]MCE1102280.1 hypothetical protein [Pseudomonas asiatica]MCE1107842.1 hypothetical protein [Pseudomonas asiatica]WJR25005.1 hypothetical protein LU687_011665 [Pseudomonas asiatica]
MDTNKMRDLKALAEAATQSHGARRVEVDHNGVHVVGDGSWKILSAWHTPDGKGAHNAEFAAAASPATILALLAEIERLTEEVALDDKIIAERDRLVDAIPQCAAHGQCVPYAIQWVKDAQTDLAVLREVGDNLKAENEQLRKALREISGQVDGNIRCTVRDVVNGLPDVQDIYGYCDTIDEIIQAALAKEASHDHE